MPTYGKQPPGDGEQYPASPQSASTWQSAGTQMLAELPPSFRHAQTPPSAAPSPPVEHSSQVQPVWKPASIAYSHRPFMPPSLQSASVSHSFPPSRETP